MMLTDIGKLFLFLLFLTVIHEIMHLLFTRVWGISGRWVRFHTVNFDPTGFCKLSTFKKVVIVLSGPVSSILIGIGLLIFGYSDYAMISFILGVINLIPFWNDDIAVLIYYLRR